jgi:hypothetical protein
MDSLYYLRINWDIWNIFDHVFIYQLTSWYCECTLSNTDDLGTFYQFYTLSILSEVFSRKLGQRDMI